MFLVGCGVAGPTTLETAGYTKIFTYKDDSEFLVNEVDVLRGLVNNLVRAIKNEKKYG